MTVRRATVNMMVRRAFDSAGAGAPEFARFAGTCSIRGEGLVPNKNRAELAADLLGLVPRAGGATDRGKLLDSSPARAAARTQIIRC